MIKKVKPPTGVGIANWNKLRSSDLDVRLNIRLGDLLRFLDNCTGFNGDFEVVDEEGINCDECYDTPRKCLSCPSQHNAVISMFFELIIKGQI